MTKYVFYKIMGVSVTILLWACARIGNPTGGPKDTIPPVVLKTSPENFSKLFNSKKIEIYFDEFVQVRDANKKIVVSPPLENGIDVVLKGKSISIKINDTLKPNTTYSMQFGNAIVDNNEGNPLNDYKYVFSTGAYIDSLSFAGKILQAFDLKVPDKNSIVMLYDNLDDSAVFNEPPYYIAKPDLEGFFHFTNLRGGTYKVYGLIDMDNDFCYDAGSDQIAFVDSVFQIDASDYWEQEVLYYRDTTDSMFVDLDSLAKISGLVEESDLDSIADSDSIQRLPADFLSAELMLFEEVIVPENQYIQKATRLSQEHCELIFGLPLDTALVLSSADTNLPVDSWARLAYNETMDTVHLWLIDTLFSYQRKMKLSVGFPLIDSLGVKYLNYDTVNFVVKYTKPRDELRLKANFKNKSTVDLGQSIQLVPDIPIANVNDAMIQLFEWVDTVAEPREFKTAGVSYSSDSSMFTALSVITDWEPGARYKLRVDSMALYSISGFTHDTFEIQFAMQKVEAYGNYTVIVNPRDSTPLVVQLLSDKEEVQHQKKVPESRKVIFENIKPNKYILKLIVDNNGNGKWDTGDLLNKLQPERVVYFDKQIEIRANWDVENTWTP